MPTGIFIPKNDEPSLELFPEREALLVTLADAVRTCRPPYVFGVHGTWGSGKTSFLHSLQFRLTGECPQNPDATIHAAKNPPAGWAQPQFAPVCVWFEAWRYQHESAPVVALLQEMRGQLGKIVAAVNEIRKLAAVSSKSAIALLEKSPGVVALLAKAGLAAVHPASLLDPLCISSLEAFENVGSKVAKAVGTVRETGEAYEKDNFRTPLQTHQLREQLDHAVGQLLGELIPKQKPRSEKAADRARRVVIFIDDLDRCEPKTAYRLLEGIKIYLSLRNCVFVLGINRDELIRIIQDGLPGKEEPNLFRAQEYLEKLCGHCVSLPDCTGASKKRLVNSLINVDDGLADIRTSLADLAGTPGFLPANPRRIKAFCNTATRLLLRRAARVDVATKEPLLEARALALVASLAQFHPDLFDGIRRYPGFLEQIRSFCTTTGDVKSKGLHAAFQKLALPKAGNPASETSVTPGTETTWNATFADVASLNVFHAQPLLFDDNFAGAAITEDLVLAYLD